MRCMTCRYDLRRLRARACPECGRAFDPADPATFDTDENANGWRRIIRRSAGVFCSLSLLAVLLPHGLACVAAIELGHWPRPRIDEDVVCLPAKLRAVLTGLIALAAAATPLVLGVLIPTVAFALPRGVRNYAVLSFFVALLLSVGVVWLLQLDPLGAMAWLTD
jgi:hypothetical protein